MAHGIISTGYSYPDGSTRTTAGSSQSGYGGKYKRILSRNSYDMMMLQTWDDEIVVWAGTRGFGARHSGVSDVVNVSHGPCVLPMPRSVLSTGATIVDAGAIDNAYALYSNGDLVMWGTSYSGQNGYAASFGVPKVVASNVSKVWLPQKYSWNAANGFTFYLDTSGNLYGAGYNGQGIAGDGTTANKTSWFRIDATKFPAGTIKNVFNHSGYYGCAFIQKTDNTIWACGYNLNGNLGNGGVTNPNSWTDVTTNWGGANEIAQVVAGNGYYDSNNYSRSVTVMRFTNGAVRTAGNNTWGSIGNGSHGTDTNVSTPYTVYASGCTQIAGTGGGPLSVHAIVSGTLKAWGYNASGNIAPYSHYWGPLGIGTQGDTGVPTNCVYRDTGGVVNNIHTTEGLLIDAHDGNTYPYRHCFFIKDTAGNVYSTGRNRFGDLAIGMHKIQVWAGNTDYSSSDIRVEEQKFRLVPFLKDISKIYVNGFGDGNYYATLMGGDLYMWGYNESGMINPISTTPSSFSVPIRMGTVRV